MICRITGKLVKLEPNQAILALGGFEYEVLIPDFVRRQLQSHNQKEISLLTIDYIDGNPQHGRMTPRLIGFLNEAEREFFEQFCSVDGVGVKKALRAMVRPVREVASAIEDQNVDALSELPGIGPALAERVVAKLRRKMAKFALMVARDVPEIQEKEDLMRLACEALVSLGHSQTDADEKIDTIRRKGKKYSGVDEILSEIYRQHKPEN